MATASALTLAVYAAPAQAQEHAEEKEPVDVVVVQATRSGRRIEDEAIRVEVISPEELEEKQMMSPGNIAMLVAETGGVRVQVTSPALGASNIRMHGMRGRYTQLLADGLPLYGGQSSSIGLLQIPPTDLGQVEIIKGSAAALYGPSALGGVINLVTRKPTDHVEQEYVVNATSRDGQDATAYASTPLGDGWSTSGIAGLSRQSRQDLDGDGWIDIPGFDRWTVRPRVFWEGEGGGSALFTVGAMQEQRDGGTMPGRTVPDGQPFPNNQDTQRYDAGLVVELPVSDSSAVHFRASGMTQHTDHSFGTDIENDRHETGFAEVSYSTKWDGTSLLGGLAYQADSFKSKTFSLFDYTYTTPALFAQIEQEIGDDLTLAGSARYDDQNKYGSHLSPRVSLLYKPGRWRVRGSFGTGFYAPTPFVEEIEAAGLSRLEPLSGLKAETAQTGSIDVGYTAGPIELSATVFGSDIDDAVQLRVVDADTVRLINAAGVTRTRGAELLARYKWESITVTGSYVRVDATEPDPTGVGRRDVPLSPKNTFGVVAMWEANEAGKIGFEAYYTGRQSLEDNPYRDESKSYLEIGLMGQINLGKVSLFVNAENLLNVRQTRTDLLVRPTRAPDGRWTVDAWEPLDGVTVNAGVRFKG